MQTKMNRKGLCMASRMSPGICFVRPGGQWYGGSRNNSWESIRFNIPMR